MQTKVLIAIFVGGALGTLLRHSVNLLVDDVMIGTWIVNASGSFLLGILSGIWMIRSTKEWLKKGLGVGLCGGFTTMATFASSTVQLLDDSMFTYALLYIVSSVVVGVAFAYLGIRIGMRMAAGKGCI